MTDLDLNLLTVLDALLRAGSVTAAAEKLHMSAPATSRALGRLRRTLDDPLLVRAGRGLVPTPLALSLAPQVGAIVEQARALLTTSQGLDLSTVDRRFTVRANDGWTSVLGGPLLAQVSSAAPGIRLRFAPEGDDDIQPLRDGSIDLDIGVIDDLGPEITVQPLWQEPWVPVVAPNHPLTHGPVTWQRLVAHPYVAISRRGRSTGPYDDLLATHGLHRKVVAITPTATTAAHLLFESDVICLFMATFAKHAAKRMGLCPIRTPDPLPVTRVSQAWHPRSENDPAHRWLRETIHTLGPDNNPP
ncbi:LysR family transcriptional regulator [Actinocrispum wychmicini]|uniref:DNA-binding transcriptional LysR family regulator n=1 Tax=Actinocrispum wychmicini TaxID=1213861 RepID=A0A4V2S418_9PSEU|nr:LysR family transcriptional regulator [Actinocrispum wychmicini]TCO46670.1 DNA-binding transcriptional LysR family regulator [Actinocrispum wychmicini]